MQNKAIRQKHERFVSEKTAEFNRELGEKENEILVLKDMVKASQLQLRAKERDTARFKQKSI